MREGDAFLIEGEVMNEGQGPLWRVRLSNGYEFPAHAGRLLKKHQNVICKGAKVLVKLTPFDLSKGCILQIENRTTHESPCVS